MVEAEENEEVREFKTEETSAMPVSNFKQPRPRPATKAKDQNSFIHSSFE